MKPYPLGIPYLHGMDRKRWLKENIQRNTMLAALEEADASKRKVWLYVAATYRRVWPFIKSEVIKTCVEALERIADGRARKRDWEIAAVTPQESFDSVVQGATETD